MKQKKLQKQSMYDEYDKDGDGIVSDEELSHVADIKKLEHDLRKQRAQRGWQLLVWLLWLLLLLQCSLSISKELKHFPILVIFFISLVVALCLYTWGHLL